MNMQEFDLMSGIEKVEVISEDAVFLEQRTEGCFKITLYQLEGFYIEIFFHLSQFTYKSIRVFSDAAALSPYLDAIDISTVCDY